MGRAESALDNAVIESWHSTEVFELRQLEHFATKAQARRRVAAWIEEYNTQRRHSALGMRSPVDYELALTQTAIIDQDREAARHAPPPALPAWRRPRQRQGHALPVPSGQP